MSRWQPTSGEGLPAGGRWWSSVFDVEGLALSAVTSACRAAARLARQRGIPVDVSTSAELVAASFAAIDHLRVDGRPTQGWAGLSGFFQAADGWVRLHGNYPHHAVVIEQTLGAGRREDVVREVAGLSAQEIEDRIVAAGGVATVVRTEEEWAAHPHGRDTRDDP
jgi:hypothetical protein